VTAAVDTFPRSGEVLTVAKPRHYARSKIDGLLVAVRAAAFRWSRRWAPRYAHAGYRTALIETAIALNAAMTPRPLRPGIQ